MAWTKPGPGRPPAGEKRGRGRPPGRSESSILKNREAAEFSRRIIYDPRYQANLLERARNGQLSPQMEGLLFYYVFGKPTEKVEITAPELAKPLQNLSEEQLAQRTVELMERIRQLAQEARDAENTVEAETIKVGVLPPAYAEVSSSGLGAGVSQPEAVVEGSGVTRPAAEVVQTKADVQGEAELIGAAVTPDVETEV